MVSKTILSYLITYTILLILSYLVFGIIGFYLTILLSVTYILANLVWDYFLDISPLKSRKYISMEDVY